VFGWGGRAACKRHGSDGKMYELTGNTSEKHWKGAAMKNASLGSALSCRAGDVDSNTFTPLGLHIYGNKSN